jgi:monoamine oxidase
MNYDTDAVIVGAGFAGLTVARELGWAGTSAVVLEARDRIGGRTWTDIRMGGERLEMGGGWVHWMQGHVWAEIIRYQLPIAETPWHDVAYWRVGDERHRGTTDDLMARMDEGMRRSIDDSTTLFSRPYEPQYDGGWQDIEHLSIADRLAALNLDDEAYALCETMWSQNFNAPAETGALTQALRWAAVSNGDWQLLLEICSRIKFRDGTASLAQAIKSDVRGDIHLGTRVSRIDERSDGVVVVTDDGREITARACVVTVPIGAVGNIEFTSELPVSAKPVIADGQSSQGFKLWIRARGAHEPFIAMGSSAEPLALLQWEHPAGDEVIAFGFGVDARKYAPTDLETVRGYVHRLMPDLEVTDFACHDWVSDPYAGQTWAMLRPNQLAGVRALAAMPGRVVFAGADYARGWCSFIDGAIESGLHVAKTLRDRILSDWRAPVKHTGHVA